MLSLVALMGIFALILVLIFVYGVIRAIAAVGAWAFGVRYRAFRRLARRYGGRCETRGMSGSPIVSFSHGGDLVRIGLAPPGPNGTARPATRIIVRFRRAVPLRLELAPVGRELPRRALKGTNPVRLGDLEFDGGFVVQANDVDMARDVLSPRARWAIHGLERLVHPGGLYVTVSPERLLTQLDRGLSENTEALFEAVAETLALRDALAEGVARRRTEGVELLDDSGSADPDAGPAVCKVCGEPIDGGPVVVCDACGTPHHRECWEYVGRCSIYGCGCKEARPLENLRSEP